MKDLEIKLQKTLSPFGVSSVYDLDVHSLNELLYKALNNDEILYNYIIEQLALKTDLYGDHKGSWQGLDKPTLSEEGAHAQVEKNMADIIDIKSSLETITKKIDNEYYVDSIVANGDYDLAFENILNSISMNNGGIINLPPKEIHLKKSIKLTNRNVTIKGVKGLSKITWDSSDNGSAITLGNDSVNTGNYVFDGFIMYDTTKTLTGLFLKRGISTAITDCEFNNIRIEGFNVGIESGYSWCNTFNSCRIHGCDLALKLGTQTNMFMFNNCSLSSNSKVIESTNNEQIEFNNCNIVTSEMMFNVFFQSILTFNNCYFEHITDFGKMGSGSEVQPSTLNINGGLITGTNKIFNLKIAGGDTNNSTHYIQINNNLRCEDIKIQQSSTYLCPHIKNGNLQITSKDRNIVKLVDYDGKDTFNFTKAYGGGSITQLQEKDFNTVTITANNGFIISSDLIVGEIYTLMLEIRCNSKSLSLRNGTSTSYFTGGVLKGNDFNKVAIPLNSMGTSLIMLSDGVEFDVKSIKLYKGTVLS